MGILSAIYGAILAYRRLGWQADAVSDIIKISILLGLVTTILAFIFWSTATLKHTNSFTGSLAGLLTAVFAIPAPAIGWALKMTLTSGDEFSLAVIIQKALGMNSANFSLGEAMAIPLSIGVGYIMGKRSQA